MSACEDFRRAKYQLATATHGELRLAVRLARGGDRFQHQIAVVDDQGRFELVFAVSDEGDDQQSWPPSPPIQQVDDCVVGADRHGLVAVGMAGTSHWSLAVETHGATVWFDVACRTSDPRAQLGSQYTVESSWEMRGTGASVEFHQPDADRSIVIAPCVDKAELKRDSTAITAVRFEPSELAITHATTVRWRYGFQLQAPR